MTTFKAEERTEKRIDVDGWPVHLVSYRLGAKYVCEADNVSPGANLARITADTREEAESQAIAKATKLLGRTHRREV
jgi:hypothetical protein